MDGGVHGHPRAARLHELEEAHLRGGIYDRHGVSCPAAARAAQRLRTLATHDGNAHHTPWYMGRSRATMASRAIGSQTHDRLPLLGGDVEARTTLAPPHAASSNQIDSTRDPGAHDPDGVRRKSQERMDTR